MALLVAFWHHRLDHAGEATNAATSYDEARFHRREGYFGVIIQPPLYPQQKPPDLPLNFSP
jgi:hypothetical protein